MGTKILIQRIIGGDPNSLRFRTYSSLLNKVIRSVKGKDTEIRIRILKNGMTDLSEFSYSYLHYINDREVFEAILGAERDGFDAVLVYCFSDPIITEARQAMNIPVLGLGQPSMLTAQMVGGRFGVVAMSPESACRNEELIIKYGMKEKAVLPVKSMPISPNEQSKMIEDARGGIEAFKQVVRAYIKEGAEAIVPACGGLALALRLAPGCSELPNGLTEVDDVPIMDIIGCAIKWAEMMAVLKKAGSSWISRVGLYARPPAELIEAVRKKIPYRGEGFVNLE